MTSEQRAEYAEWCRQRANDLQLLESVDWQNPDLEKELEGYDYGSYFCSALLMGNSIGDLTKARLNYEDLAKRIEANDD